MQEEKYLYSVNPRRPIKRLNPNVPIIRTPKSLYLSKEEVRECLKYGSVYRRFANIGENIRVVGVDVDRLHNAEYYSEEEWEKHLAEIDGQDRGSVEVNEVKTGEVSEEAPVEEDVHGGANSTDIKDASKKDSDSDKVEDTVETTKNINNENDQADNDVRKSEDPTESVSELSSPVENEANDESEKDDVISTQVQVDQDVDNSESTQTTPISLDIDLDSNKDQNSNQWKGKNKNNKKNRGNH